ncbi:hypothetical protein SAMN02746098_01357 [Desulfosporosinus lacus DSM 15449]|uniref:Uncharacterized protein n=1 Tax=Desulfosporosinus lacus DSM 15449 TaxID=1121420 RepID=A0A1M5VI12_9FIRM|nr:hypothetical protein SAMN02746098_01357 [Desulfosporosinus lacus DSM 15449]
MGKLYFYSKMEATSGLPLVFLSSKMKEGDRLAFILDETKKSIRGVMGALKPSSSIDINEAIELAKIERAIEIDSRLKELEDE